MLSPRARRERKGVEKLGGWICGVDRGGIGEGKHDQNILKQIFFFIKEKS